jgi:hypothetical protein
MSPVAAVVSTLDVALMPLTEPGDPLGIQAQRRFDPTPGRRSMCQYSQRSLTRTICPVAPAHQ